MPLLSVERVTRRFGGIVALDDVSLDVEDGEIVGLIGPNGAGKTTVFNLITRALPARLGGDRVRRDGPPAHARASDRQARHRAHLPERRALPDDDRARERARRRARAPRGASAPARSLDYVGLAAHARPARRASFRTGRRSASSWRALSPPSPRLLLLDEPAGGLNHEEVERLGDLDPPPARRLRADDPARRAPHAARDGHLPTASTCSTSAGGSPSGAPAEVQRDPAVIEAYLGTMSRADWPARARGRRGPLRPGQGAARGVARGRGGRDRRRPRRERRGQDHDAARDLGTRRASAARSAFAGKTHRAAARRRRSRGSASRTSPRGAARSPSLTVRENLRLGAYVRRDRARRPRGRAPRARLLPLARERRGPAGRDAERRRAADARARPRAHAAARGSCCSTSLRSGSRRRSSPRSSASSPS